MFILWIDLTSQFDLSASVLNSRRAETGFIDSEDTQILTTHSDVSPEPLHDRGRITGRDVCKISCYGTLEVV